MYLNEKLSCSEAQGQMMISLSPYQITQSLIEIYKTTSYSIKNVNLCGFVLFSPQLVSYCFPVIILLRFHESRVSCGHRSE